ANSGSLFGISAASYPQWKAKSFAVGGALDRSKVMGALSSLSDRGLKNGGSLFANGHAISDLIEEANELHRDNDEAKDTIVHGASAISYKTPAGIVKVVAHPYMKQGQAIFLPNGKMERVGSTDLTFDNGKN